MQAIAFRSGNEIQPEEDIVERNQKRNDEYFEVSETGALVTMREARQLLEQFCQAMMEEKQANRNF
jgi:hypothetical protein